MTLSLTTQDKSTLRTAAYGAVALVAAAGAAGSPHKMATAGTLALTAATGPVGHVLAARSNDIHLYGKAVAHLADQVLPALSATMDLLGRQNPAEAGNFRGAVLVAIEAASRGVSNPSVAAMAGKIVAALDAA
ncbi:hypothetical protein [Nonomuraea soli]|uniref:D-alanyl-D-alanine carboxypeptidase n=1 Tax=Nonomuraea soli TaxID=1032476 RepID=A0A7W0HVA6_9ACTN|nr:hypothetical protein [Nonomuraea soli]MBA2896950.1 hypothetical protein [Nonomuraea soli]